MISLDASYAACRKLTRQAGSSFYYPLWLLAREKRRAMWALYAYMRHTDDLGDNPASADDRRAALDRWRHSLQRALAGEFDGPIWPAVADAVARFAIPKEHLHAVIDGVAMDVNGAQFVTFGDLEAYCHRVASAVGLACIHIWGFSDPAAYQPALQCGVAFQLTNVLRDLKEDATQGRVYLPREDLDRFEYSFDDLRRGVYDGRFAALLEFEIARARTYFREAETLPRWLDPDARPVYTAMLGIYRELLEQISRRGREFFKRPVRVSRWRKLGIAARSFARRT